MMKRISLKYISILLCGLAVYVIIRYLYSTDFSDGDLNGMVVDNHAEYLEWTSPRTRESKDSGIKTKENSKIVVSFVVCDKRLNESLNVVKSLLLFTRQPIHLVIFADKRRQVQLNVVLTRWHSLTKNQLDFELHDIDFPKTDESFWLNLFRKCAAQRLFFPKLLPHIDSMIYVDVDTLFLGPVEELWAKFRAFNDTQIAALAEEDNNANIAWYPRFAKHPYYGKFGLNSGVMLMNLTRMREFGWMNYIVPVTQKWKSNIPWGDQDIINIILSYHESAVYILACRYNYRSDQCQHGDSCAAATARGVFLLHGSRNNFYKMPVFQAIYKAIDEHELGTDPSKDLLSKMNEYMSRAEPSLCTDLKHAFLKVPADTINSLYPKPDR